MQTRTEQLTPYHPPDLPPLHPNPSTMPPAIPLPFVMVHEKSGWEYKCILRNLAQSNLISEDELNSLGVAGWELTAAVNDSSSIHYYFKRPTR